MATAVFFHAHPDDESIATGGVMAQAAAAGHRVVLVCATDGAVGEPAEGSIPAGSTLAEVRLAELQESGRILGANRIEWLGYGDSGMENEPTNDNPDCFWQADVEEAAERLAAILRDERADLLTVYDSHGGYGHPDHIQVHRVGHRAAELAGTPHVFESTMNRDRMRGLAEFAFEGADDDPELAQRRDEMRDTEMGTPAAEITHQIDVTSVIDTKRRSMAAHPSQITPESFFLKMPDEAFAAAFGVECFIERGATRTGEPFADDLFAALADE
ncbi:MAG: PIG-L family deacetylase [Acidimicrobiales bacterium]